MKNLAIKSNNSRTIGIVMNLANSVCTAPGCTALQTICLPIYQTKNLINAIENVHTSSFIYRVARAF